MEDLDELNCGAGKDSFLFSNLDSTEYVTLESRTDSGCVVVATKDIAIGTKIFIEKPVLLYDGFHEMLEAFMDLDTESKNGVLNMYDPRTMNTDDVAFHFLFANALSKFSLDPELVQKLVVIDKYDSKQTMKGRSAICLFASKLAHYCNPNTFLRGHPYGERMECIALRPIKAGDLITYSLFDRLVMMPLPQKRTFFSRGKMCCCPQCSGPDYTRPVSCTNCQNGVLLCTKSDGDLSVWSCSNCESLEGVERRIETLEEDFDEQFQSLLVLVATEPSMIRVTACVAATMEDASTKLHPLHFHTLDLMKLYIDLSIKPEFGFAPGAHGELTGTIFCREAAKMAVSLVEKIECVAASHIELDSPTDGCINHTLVLYGGRFAFLAARLMMQCPSFNWPANVRNVVHRYVPMMKAVLQEYDFSEIERKIHAPKSYGNEPMPRAVEKKAKQRRKNRRQTNKKKKGRRR